MAGGQYFSQEVTSVVMSSLGTKPKRSRMVGEPVPLSDREKEVLHLILKEFSNAEIAEKLFISPRDQDVVEAFARTALVRNGNNLRVVALLCGAVSGAVSGAVTISMLGSAFSSRKVRGPSRASSTTAR